MKVLSTTKLAIVATVLLSFSACYFDNEIDLYGEEICDTTTVSFASDIQPIIATNCSTSGCHTSGGNGNGNFDSYSGVFSKVQNSSFENRVINQRDMPPNGFLTDCEIQKIQKWLQDGAPDN